jgi:NADPH:quinone reductase-like Zn-dependent oxidoreductase
LTEYALLSEEWIVHIPDHLSFEEAAALPTAAITAWNALTSGGRPLQAGETVLTLGSGGVSLFALQLAKLFGTRVIATTSSDDKAQWLKELGADDVINYRTTLNWHEAVHELTAGRGADHVIETIGPSTLEQSIKATAIEGQITTIGWLPSDISTINYAVIAMSLAKLRAIFAGSRAQFIAMNRAIAQGRLKPVIDRVFPFEDAKAAYRYYEEAQPFGKVIISQN